MITAIITLITLAVGLLGKWFFSRQSSTGEEDAKILEKQRDINVTSVDDANRMWNKWRKDK